MNTYNINIVYDFQHDLTFFSGVLLDTIYQIVDVGVYSAEATAELGALTVGMICVRNVTRSMGRWTGRWCYGDKLWGYYNDLSTKVTYRTKMIAYERGMSPHPGNTMEK